jgi:hypothetical protein
MGKMVKRGSGSCFGGWRLRIPTSKIAFVFIQFLLVKLQIDLLTTQSQNTTKKRYFCLFSIRLKLKTSEPSLMDPDHGDFKTKEL